MITVFTRISAALDLALPLNKRRIWNKNVNKRHGPDVLIRGIPHNLKTIIKKSLKPH